MNDQMKFTDDKSFLKKFSFFFYYGDPVNLKNDIIFLKVMKGIFTPLAERKRINKEDY